MCCPICRTLGLETLIRSSEYVEMLVLSVRNRVLIYAIAWYDIVGRPTNFI